jgi:hypothetical protein
MAHRKDRDELWASALLDQIIQRSNEDRDALPGAVVRLVKRARAILGKRRARGARTNQKNKPRE